MGFWKTTGNIIKGGVFVTKIGCHAAVGVAKGVVGTVGTVAGVINDVSKKDYDAACNRIEKKIENTICGVDQAIENTAEFLNQVDESIDQKKPVTRLFTGKNAKKLSGALTLGVGVIAATDLITDDVSEVPSDYEPHSNDIEQSDFSENSHNDLIASNGLSINDNQSLSDSSSYVASADEVDSPLFDDEYASDEYISDAQLAANCGLPESAIDNGVFVGTDQDLQNLIVAGEFEETQHVNAEDIDRNMEARQVFLEMHGYDGVPEGYEVHHIVPLSEGGADSPQNMILVTEEDHEVITAAHRKFYSWG